MITLPRKADGLPAAEKDLDTRQVRRWLVGLEQREVMTTLPLFRVEDRFSLADALKASGMSDALVWKRADFTGIAMAGDLFGSAVLHKTFVAVDEEGTEAAAATAVGVGVTSAPPREPTQTKVFEADHRFLFLIRHQATGAVLFLGRMMDQAASMTP